MAKIDLKNVERRKKNRIVLSLNDEDKEKFLKKIEAEQTTAQKFLYKKIFKEEIKDSRDFLELSYQIRKLGVMLNQFIKLIYDGKTVQDDEIIKTLEEVKEVLEKFKQEV